MSVKSGDIQSERDFESAMREIGYSNKEAKHLANFGFKSLMHKKETGEFKKAEELNYNDLAWQANKSNYWYIILMVIIIFSMIYSIIYDDKRKKRN